MLSSPLTITPQGTGTHGYARFINALGRHVRHSEGALPVGIRSNVVVVRLRDCAALTRPLFLSFAFRHL